MSFGCYDNKYCFQLIIIIVCFTYTETKVCAKQDRLNRTKYFCCTDYYLDEDDNVCKKCHIGFVRTLKEDFCVPCSDGWFGNKCLEKCNCRTEEECDHINGCVTKESTTGKTNVQTAIANENETEVYQKENPHKYLFDFLNRAIKSESTFSGEISTETGISTVTVSNTGYPCEGITSVVRTLTPLFVGIIIIAFLICVSVTVNVHMCVHQHRNELNNINAQGNANVDQYEEINEEQRPDLMEINADLPLNQSQVDTPVYEEPMINVNHMTDDNVNTTRNEYEELVEQIQGSSGYLSITNL